MDKLEILKKMREKTELLEENIQKEISGFFLDYNSNAFVFKVRALIGETEYDDLVKEYDNMYYGLYYMEQKIISYINEIEEKKT